MLKILSYFNIAFALLYFLLYLLNSNSITILAMIVIIAHNVLVLKTVQQDLAFKTWHYALALANLVFAGFLSTWLVNIIRSSLEYHYFANSWLYILISALFISGIILQTLGMVLLRR